MALFTQHNVNGYTLLELIITLSIISIVTSIAIPNFSSLINNSNIITTSKKLHQSLSLARMHALSTGSIVHVCPINHKQPNQCLKQKGFNTDWSLGWLVFADIDKDNQLGEGDEILRYVVNSNATNIIFNQRGVLRFFDDGSSRSAGFYICDRSLSVKRHLRLLYTGRIRMSDKLSENQQKICQSSHIKK